MDMESMWNTNIPWNLNGFHMEYVGSIWNRYIPWILCGFQVDSRWIPYGIHIKSMEYIYVDSIWIPCPFHMESMSIPHGMQLKFKTSSKSSL
jgi:hypothetical protein